MLYQSERLPKGQRAENVGSHQAPPFHHVRLAVGDVLLDLLDSLLHDLNDDWLPLQYGRLGAGLLVQLPSCCRLMQVSDAEDTASTVRRLQRMLVLIPRSFRKLGTYFVDFAISFDVCNGHVSWCNADDRTCSN